MPQVTVTQNEPAGSGIRLLTLDGPVPGHAVPGQYAVARIGDHKPAFFALACAPGDTAQLLVKCAGDAAEALCALEPGDSFELSEAMGKGFGLVNVAGLPLVVLINGSGISAVRGLIAGEVAAGLSRPVHVYYGVLTPEHRSFLSDIEAWANAGVRVHTVVGEPAGTGWRGATGFVQDVAAAHGLCRADVGVVLCGVPQMLEAAKAAWSAAGCPEDQVLVNF